MAEELLLSVLEVADSLGVSRSTVYTLMTSGRLPYVKIGRRRLVTVEALRAYVETLNRPGRQPDGHERFDGEFGGAELGGEN